MAQLAAGEVVHVLEAKWFTFDETWPTKSVPLVESDHGALDFFSGFSGAAHTRSQQGGSLEQGKERVGALLLGNT